ncbi:MAG: exonuclease SbcCD subunit D C-terminal domain-containing protein [Methanoregulaceae archaeon]|nr:exonuclease SbcCD subunit D C-terminal domain-containing protein [Methanoregulaceae archaeon]
MRVLHTSDWHLGNSFHERRRTPEFEAFFTWLLDLVERERIDVLLVSGDVFDNGTPGTQAQELYFNFLGRIAESSCRHVVIIAGNHDSPSLLNAPRQVFRNLNIHVIGSITEDPADEVLVLDDESGNPSLIICAVPYLRDRDVRRVAPGESIDDKVENLISGIRDHYHRVQQAAVSRRSEIGGHIPLVVMGHLYAAGGVITEDDGVREQYIGSLIRVGHETFRPDVDYLALGHLHRPQVVNGNSAWRYCGSPLPMEFPDAPRQRKVVMVRFEAGSRPEITEISIPCFQEMERVRGTFEEIESRIRKLAAGGRPVWVEVVIDDPGIIPGLREKLDRMVRGSDIEVLGVVNERLGRELQGQAGPGESLESLTEEEVFTRCLDANRVTDAERPELIALFDGIVSEIKLGDDPGGSG